MKPSAWLQQAQEEHTGHSLVTAPLTSHQQETEVHINTSSRLATVKKNPTAVPLCTTSINNAVYNAATDELP